MHRLTLAALTLIVFCATCAAAPAAEETGEVPFSFEKGHVIVKAMIKGKEPVEVIISTGAEYSTVDAGLLDKYKLPAYYTGVPPVTGHNDRLISFTKVPDVRVGPADASIDMRFGFTAEISREVGREIFGTLGLDFLKGRTVQFDFQKRMLRFLDKEAADALREKAGAAAAVLRMTEKQDEFGRNLTVPLVESVTFNDKPAKLLLDTGVVTVVALTSSAAKKLGFETPPVKGAARVDSIRVAALSQLAGRFSEGRS